MNSKRTYWLTQARWGLIVAIGGVLAVFSFRNDSDGVGYVFVVGTILVAALVYVFVDRKHVRDGHA